MTADAGASHRKGVSHPAGSGAPPPYPAPARDVPECWRGHFLPDRRAMTVPVDWCAWRRDDAGVVEADNPGTLKRLRARRARFGGAAAGLESAVVGAAGDRVAWRRSVGVAVQELRIALVDHIQEAEAPGGFYAEIASTNPRLLPAVERLRRDHDDMEVRIAELDALVAADDPSVDAVRDAALRLLSEISRHRHRGADLVWELYDVDIGGD